MMTQMMVRILKNQKEIMSMLDKLLMRDGIPIDYERTYTVKAIVETDKILAEEKNR